MSFQREPESQIFSDWDQHVASPDSSQLSVDCFNDIMLKESRSPYNGDDTNSEDAISDDNTTRISSQILQPEVLKSQVEETQFVPVELDSQFPIDFDLSPSTRKFISSNTESISMKLPLPTMDLSLLEKPSVSNLLGPSPFRFGKPPQPNNMRLTRKLPPQTYPRQLDEIEVENLGFSKDKLPAADYDLASPSAISMTSPRRVSISTNPAVNPLPICNQSSFDVLNVEDIREFSSPNRQNEAVYSLGQPLTQKDIPANHTSYFGCQPSSAELDLNARKRSSEGSISSRNTLTQTKHIPSIKSLSATKHKSQSQNKMRKQAIAEVMPFMEAAIGSNIKPETSESQLATTRLIETKGTCVDSIVRDATKYPYFESNRPACFPEAKLCGTSDSLQCLNPANESKHSDIVKDTSADSMEHEKGASMSDEVSCGGSVSPRLILADFSRDNSARPHNKYGLDRVASGESIARPFSEVQCQQQYVRQNQDVRFTRDPRAQKRGLPRTNTPQRTFSNHNAPIGRDETVTSSSLLQMAAVMRSAERKQLDEALAGARLQEVQIGDLTKDNATLYYRIEHLSEENQKLVKKIAGFRARCEQYKSHMNDVMKIQKDLKAEAKDLNCRTLDVMRENHKEMEARVLEAKLHVLNDSKTTMKEARLELARPTTIEILNRDINNQLLDLQRERWLRETLQKQLENREKQQVELKGLLSDHQSNAVSILSAHENTMRKLVSLGEEHGLRLNECRTLFESFKDSEPKPIPALTELNDLVMRLSERAQKAFQAAESGNILMQDNSAKLLSEFQHRVTLVNEDELNQHKLNASILDLREENVQIQERLESRETEFYRTENRLREIEKELQDCRAQLVGTARDLSKAHAAQQEDALVRYELQNLQTSFAIAKKEAEVSVTEMEKIRLDLVKQENLTRVGQEETSKIQEMLHQSEAKVVELENQKAACARERTEEFDTMRLSMDQAFQAHLIRNETLHNGIASGLRRQIMDAENKLFQLQKDLRDAENALLNKDAATDKIAEQVSTVAIDLSNLRERAQLMEHNRDRMSTELCLTQKQLNQCMEKDGDWSGRTEENTHKFAKQCKEFEENTKAANKDTDRLESLISELKEKQCDYEALIGNIARHLTATGVLKPGLTIIEWAKELPVEDAENEYTSIGHPMVSSLVQSPKPNSGRTRTGSTAGLPEMKPAKGILKVTNSTIVADDIGTSSHSSQKTLGNLNSNDIQKVSAVTKPLTRIMSGSSSKYSSIRRPRYSRVVEGIKNSHKPQNSQATDISTSVQIPLASTTDPVSSSPAMVQPQRNAKKRAMSIAGMDNSSRQKILCSSKP